MEIKYSEYLKEIIDTFKMFQRIYDYDYQQAKQGDLYTNDLLHAIELSNIDYAERCKIATKIKNCRVSRRKYKDSVEVLEPIIQFMDTNTFKKEMNKLESILGEMRKVEKNHQNRTYHPRTHEGDIEFKEYGQK